MWGVVTLAAASLRGDATATSSTKFDGISPLLCLSCEERTKVRNYSASLSQHWMGVLWARKLQGGFHHSVNKKSKQTKLAYSGTNRDTNTSAVTSYISTPFPGCEYLERRGHGIITWSAHMPLSLPLPPSQITLYQWNENRVKRQNKFFAHTPFPHRSHLFWMYWRLAKCLPPWISARFQGLGWGSF